MKVHVAPPKGKLEKVQYEAWLITNGFEPIWLNKRHRKIKHPLILCGGADIGKDSERDLLEIKWITWALDANQPIIGICRGMQILNKYFGGDVLDLEEPIVESHAAGDFSKAESHIEKRSQYHFVYDNDGTKMWVNSRHHQYCIPVAPNFEVTHWTEDKFVVEGIADENRQIWAVQWHPERCESDDNYYPLNKLFAK